MSYELEGSHKRPPAVQATRDQRRFEAAIHLMPWMLSHIEAPTMRGAHFDIAAGCAVQAADALLNALEEKPC